MSTPAEKRALIEELDEEFAMLGIWVSRQSLIINHSFTAILWG
jgi:hypothetical protein